MAEGLQTLTDDPRPRTDLTVARAACEVRSKGSSRRSATRSRTTSPAGSTRPGRDVGEAVTSLEGLAIEPAFDAVIAELGEMRDELNAIDPGALNDLFRAALSVAFDAIFETFDFDQMVKDAITDAYDAAVASSPSRRSSCSSRGARRHPRVRPRQRPGDAAGRLGLEEAYEQLVAGAERAPAVRAARPVLADVRAAAGRLDGFAPSAALAPLTEPLAGLGRLIDEISPEPVFAALGQALDRVAALVAELDLEPLVGELDAAVGRVRAQAEAMLVVDGLLSPPRPVHAAGDGRRSTRSTPACCSSRSSTSGRRCSTRSRPWTCRC